MSRDEVKLLGFWASPYVLRVKWALSLKGIEYEYIEEDITNKSLELLRYNPVNKKVPVLIHNGNPIVESLVIVEYIDEIWKNHPLLPKDPFERAMSRFWAKFVDDKCVPMIKLMLGSTQDEKHEAAKEAREILKILESSLNANKPFSGVESLEFMDITVAWIGIWIQIVEEIVDVKLLDEDTTPFLNKWFRNVLDVHVIKECIPPLDKLLAHIKRFQDRLRVAKLE